MLNHRTLILPKNCGLKFVHICQTHRRPPFLISYSKITPFSGQGDLFSWEASNRRYRANLILRHGALC